MCPFLFALLTKKRLKVISAYCKKLIFRALKDHFLRIKKGA